MGVNDSAVGDFDFTAYRKLKWLLVKSALLTTLIRRLDKECSESKYLDRIGRRILTLEDEYSEYEYSKYYNDTYVLCFLFFMPFDNEQIEEDVFETNDEGVNGLELMCIKESKGYPARAQKDERKWEYVMEVYNRENIPLDPSKIPKNPGKRALAKLMLNLFRGKLVNKTIWIRLLSTMHLKNILNS
uniref:Uncharacterized protein n=1 Tax=Romanomermis culicivorax TaxID=13658 RepID=A0A915K882_ROMCU